jgi:cytochrome P450
MAVDPFDEFVALNARAVGNDRDPYTGYVWARREHPVEQIGLSDFVVYRHEDVRTVLRDADTFSSRAYEGAIETVLGPSFLSMDGTEHLQHRALVAGAFRRTALERWRTEVIERNVGELLDALATSGDAELVRSLTLPLPVNVITAILGVPVDDHLRFARLSIQMLGMVNAFEEGLKASAELRDYFAVILAQRRADPRDDVISDLARAEVDGHRLDDEHIFGFLRLLLPAGMETSYRLLGSLLYALIADAHAQERIRKDRSLIPRAIEEALRWETPVQYIDRKTTRAVSLGGVDLPEGAQLSLALGSANRDEAVYDEPDRFDIDRDGPPHLAFADGPHRCLGEHLARLEITVAIDALLDRFDDIRFAGDPPAIRGIHFRSPESLPVSLRAS